MVIKSIDELNPGDVIIINGFEDNELNIVTVEEVTEDGLIIPSELGGLDYSPPNYNEIFVLSEAGHEVLINIYSEQVSWK